MSESPPTATEESGHIWIDTAGGQVNLTAEVAELVSEYDASDERGRLPSVTPEGIAQRILSIPHIAKALDRLTHDLAALHNPPEQ